MRLNVRAMAIACGLCWGFGLFLLTWWVILFDGSSSDPTFLGRIYRGFTLTPGGSFIGLLWGLVDGLLGGAVVAWVYNKACAAAPSG